MANKKLSAVIQIGGAVSSTLGAAFGAVTRETGKVGQAIQDLTNRQRQLNAELSRIGRDGSNSASLRVQYARQELDLIGRQVAKLKQRQAIEQAQAGNQARRAEIRGQIGATVAAGVALFAPLGAAVNEAANFDYELQLIGNTADMTADQVGALKRAILDTSKATGQSATNIRQGMGFLVAAGMDPQQATKFLGAIGKTATASAADVEDLSKMVFTLNDSLKITPQAMQSAIDTLAQAGKEGNVELKDMAKQLPVLGSGFVALKMEGREAAATMGAALQIARKGAADADEAANNMKNFIAKIMSPETLKKAKKTFNLDLYKVIQDAQTKGKNPFDEAMAAIMKATKGDQKAIGELFQDMQVQNFIRPMIQNWEEYKRIKDKSLGADGVVERDFATMMQTTKQQIVEVGQALGRLGIALGSIFSGDAAGGSKGFAGMIGDLAAFIEANRELVRVGVMVVGSLFAIKLATLGVAYAWNVANGIWLAGQAAWLAAPAIITAVGTALRFVGTSLLWVGRAMLLNPIGLAVTAIAGAVFLIYKYWEPLKAFFSNLWADIKADFAAVYDWIVGKVSYLMELPSRIKEKVSGLFGSSDLPPVPPAATRGGAAITDNSQHSYNIVQQPGQDAQALAREIERLRRQRDGVQSRSRLVDGVGAQ